jgi:hypothetical protein
MSRKRQRSGEEEGEVEDEKGGGGKKPGAVKVPVQATLEPGVRWHSGVRQTLSESVSDSLRTMRERADRFVLPVRERQNAITLATTPGLHGTKVLDQEEASTPLYPIMHLLAHNNSWHRASVAETLRAVAAPELAADLSALHTKADASSRSTSAVQKPGIRFVHPDLGSFATNTTNTVAAFEERGLRPAASAPTAALPRKAAERAKVLYDMDRKLREVSFFDDDVLDDDGPDAEPYGMAPGQYRLLKHLAANLGERFAQRHEHQRDFGENVPRRSIETISLARLNELRFPVHGHWRGCKQGAQCIVRQLAASQRRPDIGYTQREYLSQEAERAYLQRREAGIAVDDAEDVDGPPNLCVDDIIFACTGEYYQNLATKPVPREPINLFALEDGAYAREYLIPQQDTGIEGNSVVVSCWLWILIFSPLVGNVPMFHGSTRQFTRRTLPDGSEVSYLEDTGSVFRPSLSEANTCLGAPKARPFAGPFRFVTAPLAVFLPRFRLEEAAGAAAAWITFLRECHPAVIADRVALVSLEDDGSAHGSTATGSTSIPLLPVVWLRRAVAHHTHIIGELTPQATAMTLRVFDTHSDAAAGELLRRWMDIAFCSFERSVSLWLQHARQGHLALTIAPVALLLGAACYAPSTRVFWSAILDHGRGIHVPRSVARALAASRRSAVQQTWHALADAILGADSDTHVFWAVALFRCACAAYCNAAFYRREPAASEDFDKQAHYFMETHTHLLTHMTRAPDASSDRHLFEAAPAPATQSRAEHDVRNERAPWLALFYPAAHRVLCAEELPDLAPALAYANPWYDMGSRKTQSAQFSMLVLLFLVKVINSTCQRRGYMDILQRDIKAFPVLGRLMRLIIYCVLAGNLPHALHRLPLAARTRLAASFAPFANAEVDADFAAWMHDKRMTVWFLVREYYFFHVENAWVLERIFSDSRKWPRFKAIVRVANGEVRHEAATQLATSPVVDWNDIESVTLDYTDRKGKEHWCTSGLIMDRHGRTLPQFIKLRKGRFEEVFRSKTKGIETSLALDYAAAEAWLNTDGRLYYCHLVAWYLAQRSHVATTPLKRRLVIETRWLKALGMSEEGLRDFRMFMFEYYEWDTCDESLKKKARHLFTRRWEDYVIARALCRLIEVYRDQTVFILPVEQTLRQVHALRASIGIEPWFATPSHAGRLYYCEGCHKWASHVQDRDLVLAGDLRSTLDAHESLLERVEEQGRLASSPVVGSVRKVAHAACEALAFGSNATGATVCCFRRVFLDPLDDGRLYCKRGIFLSPSGEGDNSVANIAPFALDDGDDSEEDEDGDAAEEDPFESLAFDDGTNLGQWLRKHGADAVAEAGETTTAKGKTMDDVTLLALKTFSCNRPLTEVCLAGAYWRLHGRSYGLCVYCGRACEVLNCNKTALGLSCGKHALAGVYPDNHRIWLSLQMTRSHVLQTFAPPPPRHRCFACRSAVSVRFVEAYDFQHCLFRVPLCQYHFLCCSALIPIAQARPKHSGAGLTVVPPPLRIDHIMERVWSETLLE